MPMGAVLNLIWDYKRGYYVSERRAPFRYRARRLLEKQVIPTAREVGAAVAAVAVTLALVTLSLLVVAGLLAEKALLRLNRVQYPRVVKRITRASLGLAGKKAEPGWLVVAFILAGIPALAVFFAAVAAAYLLAGLFLMVGKWARKVLTRKFGLDFDEITRPY